MKKTVITFGLISGIILSVLIVAVTFAPIPNMNFGKGQVMGYTSIVLSFVLIFFGIRSYRENVGNGSITFGKAFTAGILITVISSLCYVATWLIIYYNFFPNFIDEYASYTIEGMKANGATQAAIDRVITDMEHYKVQYNNPFFNAAVTFMEPFPIGLVITLISAAILRKKVVLATV